MILPCHGIFVTELRPYNCVAWGYGCKKCACTFILFSWERNSSSPRHKPVGRKHTFQFYVRQKGRTNDFNQIMYGKWWICINANKLLMVLNNYCFETSFILIFRFVTVHFVFFIWIKYLIVRLIASIQNRIISKSY